MVKAIHLIYDSKKYKVEFESESNKINIDCNSILNQTDSFDIEIEFNQNIVSIRNHEYKWVSITKCRIANEYTPKILKLQNGIFVQPNIQQGIWEINENFKNKLLWKFNPKNSKPLTFYTGISNEKVIENVNSKIIFTETPSLLFATKNAIEFSRSLKPFTPIVCFTDHCDFDTSENLQLQREFFKKYNIKISKGFFLNHFSKRKDNASYQNDKTELDLWIEYGHELCYHSLSQSIKNDAESFTDFENFEIPSICPIWIDHGYQPYNLSTYKNNLKSDGYFENVLNQKKITTLWNYIDSGTSTNGVINQINPNHFTLSNFSKGNKNLNFIKKLQLIIKNIIFHYYADEDIILNYKNTATNFKKLVYGKQLSIIPKLFKALYSILIPLLKVLIFWKKHKDTPYKLAKYAPILFKHKIDKNYFYIFQTLEMVDFKKSLSKENIDLLLSECGIFIAHTYFSVPMVYHQGKLFLDNNIINPEVEQNFEYLSKKIEQNLIWNPTLSSLINYLKSFETLLLDVNNDGEIFVKNETNIIYRILN